MIRHIVLFSAKDKSDLPRIHQALSRLREIPHVRHFEVAYNSHHDALSREVDLIVYGEFDSFAQLDAYKAHPAYQAAVDIVRPLRELRIAADYEIPGKRSR
ncbi:MAG: Dabb family protein [Candidatus Competibacterales bacterium]|nr:Dabb family protein [Candidatus Competibacterales bacterium]